MASSDPAVVSRAWRTVAEMVADRGIDASMARGVGDDEILALADDNTTFAVPIAPGLSAVFHWGGQAVKKQDIFALTGDAKHVILVAASLSAATTKALADRAVSTVPRKASDHQIAQPTKSLKCSGFPTHRLPNPRKLPKGPRDKRRLGVIPKAKPITHPSGEGKDIFQSTTQLDARQVVTHINSKKAIGKSHLNSLR